MKKFIFIPLILIGLLVHANDDKNDDQDELDMAQTSSSELTDTPLNQLNREYLGDFSKERKFREQVIGKVAKLQGNKATVVDVAGTGPQEITVGKRVLNDSSFWCPDNCYVSIKFDNNLSFVKMGKQTSFHIIAEDNKLKLKLHSGYIKILFKASKKYESMIVDTPNSSSQITNAKTLFIYNTLFKKTSVINYKGHVQFSSLVGKNSIELGKSSYTYLEDKSSTPSEPQFLSPGQFLKLLSAFDIDTKQLD